MMSMRNHTRGASPRTDLDLDALNIALWTRTHDGHDTSPLVHHFDRGVQYLAIRYTERLAEAGAGDFSESTRAVDGSKGARGFARLGRKIPSCL
jgi:transposase InsO family protein